jgi:hypothetical protein
MFNLSTCFNFSATCKSYFPKLMDGEAQLFVRAGVLIRKRSRYPPSGGELVPLVFEAGGRPAEETVAFVRSWGLELDQAERSNVIRYAWQQYSTVLQSGNAEMILSATG